MAHTWETVPEDIQFKSYYLVAVEERDGALRPTMSYLDHSEFEGDGWAVVSLSEERDEAVVVVFGRKALHHEAENHGERLSIMFPDAVSPAPDKKPFDTTKNHMLDVLALVEKDNGSLSTLVDQPLEEYASKSDLEPIKEKEVV